MVVMTVSATFSSEADEKFLQKVTKETKIVTEKG
jgi:hypothetical protein